MSATIHPIEDARSRRAARQAESTVRRIATEAARDVGSYLIAASEDPEFDAPGAWAPSAFAALLESEPGVVCGLSRDEAEALYTIAFLRALGRAA